MAVKGRRVDQSFACVERGEHSGNRLVFIEPPIEIAQRRASKTNHGHGETRATKSIYADAGVTMVSQSATATDLTQEDQVDVFHRLVPYDDYQGAAIGKYLTDELGATKVFVIDNSEAYGEPHARLAEILNGLRGWAKDLFPTYEDRKVFFEGIVNGDPDPIALLRAGDEEAVERLIRERQAAAESIFTAS